MIQYLIILLDDASVSYCHYRVDKTPKPIELETLRRGIRYAMMENLMIQFVFSDSQITDDLRSEIETIDHHKLMPTNHPDTSGADVIIFSSIDEWLNDKRNKTESVCLVRTCKKELFKQAKQIHDAVTNQARLNIVLTDIDTFTEDDFAIYRSVLEIWAKSVSKAYKEGKAIQINILTDRLFLTEMNNCQAGVENITLAPNGKFYICPAFYYEDEKNSIGSLAEGIVDIKNPQLYQLDYAPICKHCDAFQCKRCVWMNKRTTLEVNTPSHEQCVVSHLERNESRNLLNNLRHQSSGFFPDQQIEEINYLDPFEIRDKFKN